MVADRIRRRLEAQSTTRTVLAFVVSLLVISSGVLVAFNGGVAAAPPDEIDDRATTTVSTGGIYPHLSEGGQICATKLESDVNRVTVTNATVKDVNIYLGDEGEVTSHMSVPSGEVNGEMVIYTNGENVLIDTMARLGICLPPGVPNPLPITLKAYYIGTQSLEANNVQLKTGGTPPEASGPTLKQVMKETNTSRSDVGLNNSTNLTDGSVNNSSTPANNTTTPANNTTTPANNTTTPKNNSTQAKNSSTPATTSETPTNTKQSTPTKTIGTPNAEQNAQGSNEQTNTKEGPKTTTQTNTPTDTPKATEPEKTEKPTQTTTTTESDDGGGIIDGIVDFFSPDDEDEKKK